MLSIPKTVTLPSKMSGSMALMSHIRSASRKSPAAVGKRTSARPQLP